MTEPIKPISPIGRVQDRRSNPQHGNNEVILKRIGELANLRKQYPHLMSDWILEHSTHGKGRLIQFIINTGQVRIEFNGQAVDCEPTDITSAEPPFNGLRD